MVLHPFSTTIYHSQFGDGALSILSIRPSNILAALRGSLGGGAAIHSLTYLQPSKLVFVGGEEGVCWF